MREQRSWLGYSRAGVEQYLSLLETEQLLLLQQLELGREQFEQELEPTRREQEKIKQEIQQLDRLEARLNEWISLNGNQ